VLNNLYKHTPLQTTSRSTWWPSSTACPARSTCATRSWPTSHQIEVITRRSEFRLDKAKRREHIVEGRIKALDVIDEIIALIRAQRRRATARDG
jgi:DNA gyrase subunit A